jgi:hypothetical protein
MKGWIAAALIIVPLLVAGAIAYWPAQPVAVHSVIIPPPDLHGRSDISDLAKEIPAVIADELHKKAKLEVQISAGNIDATEAAAFDAVIITTLTEDAGIVQLNVQIVSPKTHEEIWNNAYQSPRRQFTEMLRVTGDAVGRALD